MKIASGEIRKEKKPRQKKRGVDEKLNLYGRVGSPVEAAGGFALRLLRIGV